MEFYLLESIGVNRSLRKKSQNIKNFSTWSQHGSGMILKYKTWLTKSEIFLKNRNHEWNWRNIQACQNRPLKTDNFCLNWTNSLALVHIIKISLNWNKITHCFVENIFYLKTHFACKQIYLYKVKPSDQIRKQSK